MHQRENKSSCFLEVMWVMEEGCVRHMEPIAIRLLPHHAGLEDKRQQRQVKKFLETDFVGLMIDCECGELVEDLTARP